MAEHNEEQPDEEQPGDWRDNGFDASVPSENEMERKRREAREAQIERMLRPETAPVEATPSSRLTDEEERILAEGHFRIFTLDEQLDLANEPDDATDWLVAGWIKMEGYTFLYGREGSGKSLAAIDLAIAATHNRLWLNRFRVKQVNTLYIDDDSNTGKTWRGRMQRMGGEYGNNLYSFLLQNVELDDYMKRYEILLYCKKYNIKLVVMDAFQRFHSMHDKDSVAMRRLNVMIKEFFRAGITVVMLHHATKSGSFQGSTEIMSIADNSYMLEPVKRGRLHFSISPVKVRDVLDGNEPVSIVVMPLTIDKVLRLDSVSLTEYKAKYAGSEDEEDEEKVKAPPLYKQIVDVMRRCLSPVSVSKLTEMMGLHARHSSDVKVALVRLMESQVVEEVEGVRRGVVAYTLNLEAAELIYDDLDSLDDDLDSLNDANDDEMEEED